MKQTFINKIILSLLLISTGLSIRCAKDLGNYAYHEINELEIQNFKESYSAYFDVDTLRISPTFESSFNITDENKYEFRWVIKEGSFLQDTIGRSAALVYPVKKNIGTYTLQYRIKDKETGVTFFKDANLAVSTPYTRGLLIVGEDKVGNAEAEMLSMVNDTAHIKDLIKNSGINTTLRGPLQFLYGGGYDDSHKLFWIFTESGSYYFDRHTMKSTASSTLSNFLLPTDPIDVSKEYAVAMAPQIKSIDGTVSDEFYKVALTNNGNIYTTYTSIGGGMFLNPVNRTSANFNELLPAAPYILYPIGSMSSMMWYDTKNDRFMSVPGFLFIDYSNYPEDRIGDVFAWNLGAEGKKMIYAENTFNTDGGYANGNTFAVVKNNAGGSNIYKFHAQGSSPVKIANYAVKSIAPHFEEAEQYAFSSTRTVVFYTYQKKLYAYDYNPGNERFYEFNLFAGQDITMIKFDTQQYPAQNSLYVAAYGAQSGGTLQRFTMENNPNTVNMIPVPHAKWENLLKIKDVNWKAEKF